MASVIIGIFLVIVSVVTWLGHVTTAHAIAILLGAIGVLLIIGGVVPVRYFRRELKELRPWRLKRPSRLK